jgi:hypothetical protein
MSEIISTISASFYITMYLFGYIGILIGSFLMPMFGMVVLFSINYPEDYLNIVKMSKYIIENSDNLTDQIIISQCKQYYTYKGIHYDIAFPVFWVLTESEDTGPNNCNNCKDYGTLRGVFIMYCANCCQYCFNNECGYGAISNGVEQINGGDVYISAWHTYLNHRDLTRIGLPEELENVNFNIEGFTYKLKYEYDENDMITICYPGFVENDPEEHTEEHDDEEGYEEDYHVDYEEDEEDYEKDY